MAWSSSGLRPLLGAFALVGGSLLRVADAAAIAPPVEHTVVSRATLLDPLDVSLTEPSDLEVAQLTIGPRGTTGARRYAGPTLVSVTGGTASRSLIQGGSCRVSTVLPGVAYFVAAGQVEQVRNDGPEPLRLQTTSLAPAGERPSGPAPATSPCLSPSAVDVSGTVVTHSTIPGAVHISSDGPTDIVTSRFVFQPGASSGWHSHPGGMLVSIDEGHFHWVLVEKGRCTRRDARVGTGYWERPAPGEETHDFVNGGGSPATFHYVGLSSRKGPLVGAQAPRPECGALTRH